MGLATQVATLRAASKFHFSFAFVNRQIDLAWIIPRREVWLAVRCDFKLIIHAQCTQRSGG